MRDRKEMLKPSYSGAKMFRLAKIKLTLWYLLIIMLVSGFFSFIVYRGFTKELGRGFRFQTMHLPVEKRLFIQNQSGFLRILPFVIYPEDNPPEEYLEIVNIAKHRFAIQLLMVNTVIFFLASLSGYFLAGKTLQPIEVMVEKQKRFVADASHEIRTPLASMKTEIEVTLRDKKAKVKDFKDLLKSNLQEIDKLRQLSDNLLLLSQYESSANNLSMVKVDIKEVIEKALKNNESYAAEKNILIKKDLQKTFVWGNFQSLFELFSVLINNAIKYSFDKGKVFIRVKKKKKEVVVEVIDQGIGIEQKDIPFIFDRFYRADTSRTKFKVDGYGLGLSIAKSIVEIHKGEIKVRSKPNKGSIFTVIIPI